MYVKIYVTLNSVLRPRNNIFPIIFHFMTFGLADIDMISNSWGILIPFNLYTGSLNINISLTISDIFSAPINCSDLEFQCSFEVLHLIIFQMGKKLVRFANFFPFGIFFPSSFTKRQKKFITFCLFPNWFLHAGYTGSKNQVWYRHY